MVPISDERTAVLVQLRLPDREPRHPALARPAAAGPASLAVVREGLSHPHCRVRHSCRRFFDQPFDPGAVDHFITGLTGRNRKVRQQALHALSCDACKPGESPAGRDITALVLERLRADSSVHVRRCAAGTLIQLTDARRGRGGRRGRGAGASPRPTQSCAVTRPGACGTGNGGGHPATDAEVGEAAIAQDAFTHLGGGYD